MLHNTLDGIVHDAVGHRCRKALEVGIQRPSVSHRRLQQWVARRFLIGADIVIHYDPWWNIAVQDQATDRAHRIGQNKVVTVFRMIAKNTIEEKIIELQQRKKELAEDILSGEGISSSLITREDLEFILGKSI